MIATGMTFLLGVFLTTLIVLLVGPTIWRKAQSLARRDYEATIPASANEIRAEFDTVRAAAALTVRQHEILSAKAREKTVRVQAQLGRSTVENVEILKRNRDLLAMTEDRAAEVVRLTATLASRDDENQSLTKSLAATRREAELRGQELSALAARFEDLSEIAEERKIQLVAIEAKLDRLADAQRVSERLAREQQATIERLRADAAHSEQATARDKAALTQLNERITALLTGIAERDSEIARLSPARQPQTVAGPALSAPAPADLSATPAPAPATVPASAQGEDAAEIQSASKRLRAALARNAETAQAPEMSRAEIRDRVSDIAARVIRMTAATEAASPAMKRGGAVMPPAGGAPAGTEDGRAPSLAERVRRLAKAEPNQAPGAGRSQSAGAGRE